jgi:hypothetical protein
MYWSSLLRLWSFWKFLFSPIQTILSAFLAKLEIIITLLCTIAETLYCRAKPIPCGDIHPLVFSNKVWAQGRWAVSLFPSYPRSFAVLPGEVAGGSSSVSSSTIPAKEEKWQGFRVAKRGGYWTSVSSRLWRTGLVFRVAVWGPVAFLLSSVNRLIQWNFLPLSYVYEERFEERWLPLVQKKRHTADTVTSV